MLPNGSWTGVMGYLTRREADFALYSLTLTQQRAAHIDYTPAYFSDGYGILKLKRENTGGAQTFMAPFACKWGGELGEWGFGAWPGQEGEEIQAGII